MTRPLGEVRSHTGKPTLEGDGRTITGHAAVFDQWTTIYSDGYGEMRERIRPGAFKRAIAESQDVRALFNHDPNYVLGRTKTGTLELAEDKAGLLVRITPPETGTIRDLVLAPIQRGDVDGMSFAFLAVSGDQRREETKDGATTIDRGGDLLTIRTVDGRQVIDRELVDLDLFDVSAVTYPAYDGTDLVIQGRAVPDLRSFVAEIRASVRRPTPRRESHRQWLESTAVRSSALASGSAAHGRKERDA
jgi:uncharacterized protein